MLCEHGQEPGNCPICSQAQYPIDDDFGQQMHAMGMLRSNLEEALGLLRRVLNAAEGDYPSTSLESDIEKFLAKPHVPEDL